MVNLTAKDGPHVLYRFYAKTGELLYVGITHDPPTRFSTHQEKSEWYSKGIVTKLETFNTRQELVAAERLAIQTERPTYNVVHNGPDKIGVTDKKLLLTMQSEQPAKVRDIFTFRCFDCEELVNDHNPGWLGVKIRTCINAEKVNQLAGWEVHHTYCEDNHNSDRLIIFFGDKYLPFLEQVSAAVGEMPAVFAVSNWFEVYTKAQTQQGYPHKHMCDCEMCEEMITDGMVPTI